MLEGDQISARIKHGDSQRQEPVLFAQSDRVIDDGRGVGQGQGRGQVFDIVVGHGGLSVAAGRL